MDAGKDCDSQAKNLHRKSVLGQGGDRVCQLAPPRSPAEPAPVPRRQRLTRTPPPRPRQIAALHAALKANPCLRLTFLVDYLRSTRETPLPSSGSLCASLAAAFPAQVDLRFFHSPNLAGWMKRVVPRRFDEGWGTQHLKCYGFDDDVIMSGYVLRSPRRAEWRGWRVAGGVGWAGCASASASAMADPTAARPLGVLAGRTFRMTTSPTGKTATSTLPRTPPWLTTSRPCSTRSAPCRTKSPPLTRPPCTRKSPLPGRDRTRHPTSSPRLGPCLTTRPKPATPCTR